MKKKPRMSQKTEKNWKNDIFWWILVIFIIFFLLNRRNLSNVDEIISIQNHTKHHLQKKTKKKNFFAKNMFFSSKFQKSCHFWSCKHHVLALSRISAILSLTAGGIHSGSSLLYLFNIYVTGGMANNHRIGICCNWSRHLNYPFLSLYMKMYKTWYSCLDHYKLYKSS